MRKLKSEDAFKSPIHQAGRADSVLASIADEAGPAPAPETNSGSELSPAERAFETAKMGVVNAIRAGFLAEIENVKSNKTAVARIQNLARKFTESQLRSILNGGTLSYSRQILRNEPAEVRFPAIPAAQQKFAQTLQPAFRDRNSVDKKVKRDTYIYQAKLDIVHAVKGIFDQPDAETAATAQSAKTSTQSGSVESSRADYGPLQQEHMAKLAAVIDALQAKIVSYHQSLKKNGKATVRSAAFAAEMRLANIDSMRKILITGEYPIQSIGIINEVFDFKDIAEMWRGVIQARRAFIVNEFAPKFKITSSEKIEEAISDGQLQDAYQVKAAVNVTLRGAKDAEKEAPGAEKARGVALGLSGDRAEKAESSWGKKLTSFLTRVVLATTIAILLGTPILTTLLVALPMGWIIGALTNRLAKGMGVESGMAKFVFKFSVQLAAMLVFGAYLGEIMADAATGAANAVDPSIAKDASTLWEPLGKTLESMRDSAQSTIGSAIDYVNPFDGASTDAGAAADAGPVTIDRVDNVEDVNKFFEKMFPSLPEFRPDAETAQKIYENGGRFISNGEAYRIYETLDGGYNYERIPLNDAFGAPMWDANTRTWVSGTPQTPQSYPGVTPEGVGPAVQDESLASSETTSVADTSPADAPNAAAPTDGPTPVTGGESPVTPPVETATIYPTAGEGMIGILQRLQEQAQQAAAQGATFPVPSLADQLLHANGTEDLVKIATDNGWFNAANDLAPGTPDSIVVRPEDAFSIKPDGSLGAPEGFGDRGITDDTGTYTSEGFVKR
ncbi:MAG: hypothetical protein AAB573_02380 [Patescibacteria group bacterium]